MRQLMPHLIGEVDPFDIYPAAPRPAVPGRPWVMINMIASADGAVAVGGTSEALGNPADQAVFSAVRASADWIVVAAGTARVERYDRPRPGSRARRARIAAARAERPGLAVVSASLRFDLDLPMFTGQPSRHERPLILTGSMAPEAAVCRLEAVAEVVRLPSPRPDPAGILAELRQRGAEVVLCEGGPSFNAQFADAAMIDELCLSTAPLIAGGPSPRVVAGSQLAVPLEMELAHLLEADDTLFARYLMKSSR